MDPDWLVGDDMLADSSRSASSYGLDVVSVGDTESTVLTGDDESPLAFD